MTFNDFIKDAQDVINHFAEEDSYSTIYIIGHGQGSLVGMLAISEKVTGFISIAGPAKPINQVILEQIEQTAPGLLPEAERVFNVLKSGKTTSNYPPALANIFNLETQQFMASWMAYNPTEIISRLELPILIINGTKDLQVSQTEAEELKAVSNQAQLRVINNMNHVLFIIDGNDLENSKSYNESFRKIAPTLIDNIVRFIQSK